MSTKLTGKARALIERLANYLENATNILRDEIDLDEGDYDDAMHLVAVAREYLARQPKP